MSTHFEIDHARRLVRSTSTGRLTDEDLRAHNRELIDSSDFDPVYRHLWDVRGVTELDVTTGGLRGVRSSLPWTKHTRRAFVCGSDEVFGVARMAEMLNDEGPSEIHVFRDMSEATDWLGLDPID